MEKVIIVLNIIIYILIKSAKCNIDCNVQLQTSQQCAALSRAKSNRSCNWPNEKFVYSKKQLKGFIDVQLPNLATCNSENYKLTLRINENVTTPEMCHSNFGENVTSDAMQWKKHSGMQYYVHELQSNASCKKYNNGMPAATFDYMFSGCYVLEIFSNENGFLYQSLPTFIVTDYKKKLVDKDVIFLQTQFRNISKELQIAIIINSTDIPKPPSINTLLMENPCQKACQQLEAVTRVDYIDDNFIEYNENFIPCRTSNNVTWNCTYSKDFNGRTLYTCRYRGLKPGSYGFRYGLLDEHTRCNSGSLWFKPGNACYGVVLKIVVPKIEPNKVTNYDLSTEDSYALYIVIPILIIIIFLCVITFVRVKCLKVNYKQASCELPDLRGEAMPLNTREILIIYSRDCEVFTTMMKSFKLLLNSLEKDVCILDINMDNETINIDPENWIMDKISNKNTKVILFLNNCGLVFYENQPAIAYRNPTWQDDLFPYAIKQLKNTSSRNYRNFFVVEMAGILYNTSVFDDLNPDVRYVMPKSINFLLNNIFPGTHGVNEAFLRTFNDHCRRYNEFCEENPDYVKNVLKID